MLSAEYKMLTEVDATSNRTWNVTYMTREVDSAHPIIPAWKISKPWLEVTKYLIKCLHAEPCKTEHSSSLMLGNLYCDLLFPENLYKRTMFSN